MATRRIFNILIIILALCALARPECIARADTGEAVSIETAEHTVKTEDGWDISMTRYGLKGREPKSCKAAVILCHGFNFNNMFWDLDERASLARFLTRNGYDVWVPSLRGSGLSSKPVLSTLKDITRLDVKDIKDIPLGLAKAPFDITKFNWTIDDHIHKDAPAIIGYVKKISGFDKVYWIGHSMGGIIMFGYLETEKGDDIAGFIPIGSMAAISSPLSPQLQAIADQKEFAAASLIINTRAAADLRTLTLGAVKYPIEELLLSRENMYEDVVLRLFRVCIEDTSPGVVAQFSNSLKAGRMLSHDGKYDYTANLTRVSAPVLIMGGGADGFVTEKALKESYNGVSSGDKSIIIFSKANGYSADYGHCDLMLGKDSEKEVYPKILEWLDKRTVEAKREGFIGSLWRLMKKGCRDAVLFLDKVTRGGFRGCLGI